MPFDEEELDQHGECRAEIERLQARETLLNSVIERQALALMKIRTMQGDPIQIARAAMDNSDQQQGKSDA